MIFSADQNAGPVKTMKCPSCGAYIRTDDGAAQCRCGWRQKPDAAPTVEPVKQILREVKAEPERLERIIQSL